MLPVLSCVRVFNVTCPVFEFVHVSCHRIEQERVAMLTADKDSLVMEVESLKERLKEKEMKEKEQEKKIEQQATKLNLQKKEIRLQ